MKTGNMRKSKDDFEQSLEARFNKKEIHDIRKNAELEVNYIHQMKKIMMDTLDEYSKKHNTTIDDIAEITGWSKYKINKLKKGEYNISIPDFARFLARLHKDPTEIFNMEKIKFN